MCSLTKVCPNLIKKLMSAKNLCAHALRLAKSLTSKISSSPDLTSPRRMDGAGTPTHPKRRAEQARGLSESRKVADWMRSPSDWVGSAVIIMLSLTLALLAGCAGLVSGKSATSTPPPTPPPTPAAPQDAPTRLPVG